MAKNTHASFGYVPWAATIDRFLGENPSNNIGMPSITDSDPIANTVGVSPYIPMEGLLAGIEGNSIQPYQLGFFYEIDHPDTDINDYAAPYSVLELEGIIASVGFSSSPIEDFFKMQFTLDIVDPSSNSSSVPRNVESLGQTDPETGFPNNLQLLDIQGSNTLLQYSSVTNVKRYSLRIGIVGGTPGISYNIKYMFF
jgi:hypothetical protein